MKKLTKKQQRKEDFRVSRTSWKWFERRLPLHPDGRGHENLALQLQIEILKELQFLNDK